MNSANARIIRGRVYLFMCAVTSRDRGILGHILILLWFYTVMYCTTIALCKNALHKIVYDTVERVKCIKELITKKNHVRLIVCNLPQKCTIWSRVYNTRFTSKKRQVSPSSRILVLNCSNSNTFKYLVY